MCSQNAAYAISGIQILKIFWRIMPPYPPINLVPSALEKQISQRFRHCAKVEGEACGGLWWLDGICDQGLFCKGSDRLYMMMRGICAQQTPSINVTTEVNTEPGVHDSQTFN
jgi:hypothetical protein